MCAWPSRSFIYTRSPILTLLRQSVHFPSSFIRNPFIRTSFCLPSVIWTRNWTSIIRTMFKRTFNYTNAYSEVVHVCVFSRLTYSLTQFVPKLLFNVRYPNDSQLISKLIATASRDSKWASILRTYRLCEIFYPSVGSDKRTSSVFVLIKNFLIWRNPTIEDWIIKIRRS